MVTVTYPNHHRELTNGLWNLLLMKQGLDYQLKCGERTVRGHGVVLRLFLSTVCTAQLVPFQEVAEGESPPDDDLLESVLEFLYKGAVTLARDRLDDLQAVARQLDFGPLVEAVEETKRCKPVMLIIPRVDQMPAETSGEIRGKNKLRQSSRKPRLSRPVVEGGTDQSDVSDSPDWQPHSSERVTSSRSKRRSPCKRPNRRRATPEVTKEPASTEDQSMVLRCYRCNFKALSIAQLTFHHASEHNVSIQTYPCSKCRDKFVTEAEMLEHSRDCDSSSKGKTKTVLHRCQFCRIRFKSAESFDEHMSNHPMFKCTVCDYASKYDSNLVKHLKSVHFIDGNGNPVPKIRCSECNFYTGTNGLLFRHMRRKHPGSKVKTKAQLHNSKFCYIRVESAESNRSKFKCNKCDFESPSNSNLVKHLKCVHRIDVEGNPVSELKCSECDYSSSSHFNLWGHMRRMHPDSEATALAGKCKFKCKFCEKRFRSKVSLAWHMTNHKRK